MATLDLPGSSILQVLVCKPGKSCDSHPKTSGLVRKWNAMSETGASALVNLWSARNIITTQTTMETWRDNQRGELRGVSTDRNWGVAQPCTQQSFEASGQPTEATGAILMVTGTLTNGATSAKEHMAAVQAADPTMGTTAGQVPGAVGKIYLQDGGATCGLHKPVVGACLLFVDAEAMDSYVASEEWARERAETPWEGVAVEKFVLNTGTAASA
tara:strand:- start:320 stop:961 length:642 start_codon:yes stop_codon:yes gene_type:complete